MLVEGFGLAWMDADSGVTASGVLFCESDGLFRLVQIRSSDHEFDTPKIDSPLDDLFGVVFMMLLAVILPSIRRIREVDANLPTHINYLICLTTEPERLTSAYLYCDIVLLCAEQSDFENDWSVSAKDKCGTALRTGVKDFAPSMQQRVLCIYEPLTHENCPVRVLVC